MHGQMSRASVGVKGTVAMVLHDLKTGRKFRMITNNIVTNDGDTHYAEKGADQGTRDSTNGFSFSGSGSASGVAILGTAGNAPAATSSWADMTTMVDLSQKSIDSGYPTTSDADGDNPTTGADVCSYRFSYGAAEAIDTGIDRVLIAESGGSSGSPILMYAVFASSVNKTASDTLKVFVNHTFNGV